MQKTSLHGALVSFQKYFSAKLCMLCLVIVMFSSFGNTQAEPYKFGVSIRERNIAVEYWSALNEYLSAQINAPIRLLPIKPAGMVVRAPTFDFILTNPVSAVIIAEQYGHDCKHGFRKR